MKVSIFSVDLWHKLEVKLQCIWHVNSSCLQQYWLQNDSARYVAKREPVGNPVCGLQFYKDILFGPAWWDGPGEWQRRGSPDMRIICSLSHLGGHCSMKTEVIASKRPSAITTPAGRLPPLPPQISQRSVELLVLGAGDRICVLVKVVEVCNFIPPSYNWWAFVCTALFF